MAIFKCKMCGGDLEVSEGQKVGTCLSCGTKQTLPVLSSSERENLYERANHFRRNNEYDKAMAVYEKILEQDGEDAEAYWSLVLCKFGIEYVEDPATHKRKPTVNRAQFSSVYADENYKAALKYADESQKYLYQEEAKEIAAIQEGILKISKAEKPFDVFICYKETDNYGRRTQDSVLANDLYHQLTQEGFRVFFSRITLEDKLGTAYEPYIFAALNSAKVMVVIGTKAEYMNAVWVKNEWSRFLSLVKNNPNKVLIPAYKDMDPYDLPEEFSHLQAQDMSKLGFMQDLIRGIKKLTGRDAPKKEERKGEQGGADIEKLLKRVHIFLENKEFTQARSYCSKVLDLDPENAEAYICILLSSTCTSSLDELNTYRYPLDENKDFKNALRFATEEQRQKLKSQCKIFNERIAARNNRIDKEIEEVEAQSVVTAKECGILDCETSALNSKRYAVSEQIVKEKERDFVVKRTGAAAIVFCLTTPFLLIPSLIVLLRMHDSIAVLPFIYFGLGIIHATIWFFVTLSRCKPEKSFVLVATLCFIFTASFAGVIFTARLISSRKGVVPALREQLAEIEAKYQEKSRELNNARIKLYQLDQKKVNLQSLRKGFGDF